MGPRQKRRGEPPDGTPLGFLADFPDGQATVVDRRSDDLARGAAETLFATLQHPERLHSVTELYG